MISLVFTDDSKIIFRRKYFKLSKHMLILKFLSPLTVFIAKLLLVFLTDVIFSDKYSYQ